MTESLPPAVLAAVTGQDAPEPTPLEPVIAALVPLADSIRTTLASIALLPIAQATPEQRSQIVRARDEIERIRRDATTWIDAIDLSFRHAAQALGARQIPLADGVVSLEAPRVEYKVDVAALRKELREVAAHDAGNISLEEIDSIFETIITEKADNSRLNYFARNRGDEVAEIIERHRKRVEGNPLSARLTFKRKADR